MGKPLILISVDNIPMMSHAISYEEIVKYESIISVKTVTFYFDKQYTPTVTRTSSFVRWIKLGH